MNPPLTTAKLTGRVAIVTGATQGVGAGIARVLAAAGARVVIAGIDVDAGKTIAAGIGAQATFIETDITDDDAIDRCIDVTLRACGRLDLLVNNACRYEDNGLASTREQWHRTLDVNLVSAAIFAQKASAHMRPGGAIINLGSTGGKFGAAGRALYPASKAALQQITKNLAATLAPRGIRVLSVSPAWTWSPSMERMSGGSIELADQVGARVHPLGRVGRVEEIGRVVAFAASDEASWMTGVDLAVDGGFSMLGPDRGLAPAQWFKAVVDEGGSGTQS